MKYLLCLLLTGCATGVKMTDEEAAACRSRGCSAWTNSELIEFAKKIFREGFSQGASMAGKPI